MAGACQHGTEGRARGKGCVTGRGLRDGGRCSSSNSSGPPISMHCTACVAGLDTGGGHHGCIVHSCIPGLYVVVCNHVACA